MALITIPTTPEKGVAQSYSLNLTDLFALVTNSYYTTQDNISKIIVLYVSATGNQLENINFIPDGVSTTINSSALFASQALDSFQVSFIAIIDKQNGRYVVPAASIPSVANYNLEFNIPVPGLLFTRNFVAQNSPIGSETTGTFGPGQPLEFVPGVGLQVNQTSMNYYGFLYDMVLPPGTYTLKVSYTLVSLTYPNAWLRFLTTPAGDKYGILTANSGGYVGGGISNTAQSIDTTNPVTTDVTPGVKTYTMTLVVDAGKSLGSIRMDGFGLACDMSIQKFEVFGNVSAPVAWVNPAPDVYNIEPDGGLTNGPNRGSALYYSIFSPSQALPGDFEIIFNVGNYVWDTAFGVTNLANTLFTGATASGSNNANIHVNNSNVFGAGPLTNNEFKITRVGDLVTFYINGISVYSQGGVTATLYPVATLTSGGSLNSASLN